MTSLPAAAMPATAALAAVPVALAPDSIAAKVSYMATFVLLVVVSWIGARQRKRPLLAVHRLVAGALASWFAGDVTYAVLSATVGDPGYVTFSSYLWVGGNVLLAIGLIRMSTLRAPGRLREGLLDALALTTVVAALFWQFLVSPGLADGMPPLATLFAVAYPLCDVILFAAIAVVVFSPGRRGGPTGHLVGAIIVKLLADTASSIAGSLSWDFNTERLDGAFLVANALIVAALWHPRADELTDGGQADNERLHSARVVFLALALIALPALAMLRSAATRAEHVAILLAMAALSCIILARFLYLVRDQERTRAALAHRATHDQLTGLVNRAEFHTRVDAAIRRGDGPGVIFIDLDGFKQINDGHGHAAGDYVLVEVARRLRAATRAQDTVARLGGDEFVVLTTDGSIINNAVARLQATIQEPIGYRNTELHARFSIGSASADSFPEPTVDALLAAADAAMYRAKSAGRTIAPEALAHLRGG